MIQAEFQVSPKGYRKVVVSGHAGYAEHGQDIVCSAVTSAVQLTANGLTEILASAATVNVWENRIAIGLKPDCLKAEYDFMAALFLQLKILSEDFPETIKLIITEVQ